MEHIWIQCSELLMHNRLIWTTSFGRWQKRDVASGRGTRVLLCQIKQCIYDLQTRRFHSSAQDIYIPFRFSRALRVRCQPCRQLEPARIYNFISIASSGIHIYPGTWVTSLPSLLEAAGSVFFLHTFLILCHVGIVTSSEVCTMSWYNNLICPLLTSCIRFRQPG